MCFVGFFLEGDDCNLISISNAMAARNGDINEFNPFAFTIISLNELDNTYESQF